MKSWISILILLRKNAVERARRTLGEALTLRERAGRARVELEARILGIEQRRRDLVLEQTRGGSAWRYSLAGGVDRRLRQELQAARESSRLKDQACQATAQSVAERQMALGQASLSLELIIARARLEVRRQDRRQERRRQEQLLLPGQVLA
jgi:hypothetical protein